MGVKLVERRARESEREREGSSYRAAAASVSFILTRLARSGLADWRVRSPVDWRILFTSWCALVCSTSSLSLVAGSVLCSVCCSVGNTHTATESNIHTHTHTDTHQHTLLFLVGRGRAHTSGAIIVRGYI